MSVLKAVPVAGLTVHQIGTDWVLGVGTDLDVQRVRLHHLSRPEPPQPLIHGSH